MPASPEAPTGAVPCTIAPMAIADYDEVVALWRDCPGIGMGESDERGPVAAYLERNPGLSLVARAGGRLVGAMLSGHDGRRGYLHHLGVAASHRRDGIGKALVERAVADLRALGIPKVNIFVFDGNAAGTAFWEAMGWRKQAWGVMQRAIGAEGSPR